MHLAYPASLLAFHSTTWKQIIQIQHNRIKNPNWQGATSSKAIYKHGQGFELRMTENKSSKLPERDSNPVPPDCESYALTTWPLCLLSNEACVAGIERAGQSHFSPPPPSPFFVPTTPAKIMRKFLFRDPVWLSSSSLLVICQLTL